MEDDQRLAAGDCLHRRLALTEYDADCERFSVAEPLHLI